MWRLARKLRISTRVCNEIELPWTYQLAGLRGVGMRVRVDTEKCQGHNRCFSLAVELFDVDDYGYATELDDGIVPDDLEDKARLAAANCPEFAISIEE